MARLCQSIHSSEGIFDDHEVRNTLPDLGWGYTEEQYRDGLLRLMETFKEHADGAKLIWAMTTPIRKSDDVQQVSERTERVKARNQIAAEIMKDRNVPTDDLYGLAEAHPEFFSGDGVHYNGKGRETQGMAVAESVLRCLPRGDSFFPRRKHDVPVRTS